MPASAYTMSWQGQPGRYTLSQVIVRAKATPQSREMVSRTYSFSVPGFFRTECDPSALCDNSYPMISGTTDFAFNLNRTARGTCELGPEEPAENEGELPSEMTDSECERPYLRWQVGGGPR